MHYAVQSQNEKLINYLFTKFGSLNIENSEGVRPADLLRTKQIKLDCFPEECQNIDISEGDVVVEFEAQPSLNFHDFEAIQMLGRGSFGEVFLVRMRSDGKKYAMKVLRKDKIFGGNLVKYALVERNVLSVIKHPFIVSLSFAFQSPQKLYLVLDYCAGGNLTSYILRQRHFNESIAKFYLCEIILALEELHKNGIIYRDLKPDNVVIDADGHAMLTDFGLSKQGISDNISAKSFCGSIAYLAPEMIKRRGHGKAVDWYLLGVILYEMLIGVPPFYSNNKDQLFYNIEHMKPVIPPRLSEAAGHLIRKLLKKDPERRLGSHGSEEVKNHRFLSDIDWTAILNKVQVPPLKPVVMMIPGYIPRNHVMEDFSSEPDTRHLEGWSFISK
jgi:serine/threonine protein kinase